MFDNIFNTIKNAAVGLLDKIPGVQQVENVVHDVTGGGQPAPAPQQQAPQPTAQLTQLTQALTPQQSGLYPSIDDQINQYNQQQQQLDQQNNQNSQPAKLNINGPTSALQKVQPPTSNFGQNLLKNVSSFSPHSSNSVLNAVEQGGADLAKGIVEPAIRGGVALTNLQNTGQLGESGKQFAADTLSTGLLGVGGEGVATEGGLNLAAHVLSGARTGAAVGGLSSGAQAAAQNNATPLSVLEQTAIGTGAGALLGGATGGVTGLVKLRGSDAAETYEPETAPTSTPETPATPATPAAAPAAQPDVVAQTLGIENPGTVTNGVRFSRLYPYEDYVREAQAQGTTPVSQEEFEGAFKTPQDLEQEQLTPQDRDALLNSDAQQTTNQISPQAANAKGVIGETEGIVKERMKRFNDAINIGSKLDDEDKAKLSDAVNGVAVKGIHNQAVFTKTVSALKDAYDYSLAADRAGGGQTLRWNNGNYSPLYFKADEGEMNTDEIPAQDRVIENGKQVGYRAGARTLQTYGQSQRDPLFANALEDARQYANSGYNVIRNQLLYNNLKKLYPGEITNDLNIAKVGNTDMVHAAKGNLPFNVSKGLDNVLRGYKSSELDNAGANAALDAAEKGATVARSISFLGAPIHYANLTRSFLSTTVPSLHWGGAIKGEGGAILSAVSPKAYDALEAAADKSGVREYSRSMGIVEKESRPNLLRSGTGIKGAFEKYSPVKASQRSLNRFTNVLGWRLAELERSAGVKPGTDQGVAIAGEVNKVLDTINAKMEGLNPVLDRLANAGSIAPHWIRANLGLVKDTLPVGVGRRFDEDGNAAGFKFTAGKGGAKGFGLNNAGDIARTNVIGGHLLIGATAVLYSAMNTGQMPTLMKALTEAGLTPQSGFAPNIETGGKNPKGESVVTNFPTDPIGMAYSLVTDPGHFMTAREIPLLSAVTQFIDNKDWAGNQIVDPSQPGWQAKLAQKVVENSLQPFAAQDIENPGFTTSQKIEAMFGLRTHRDPTDPQYQASVAYEQAMQNSLKGASQQDAHTIQIYLGRQMNGDGVKISPGTAGGYYNAQLLLGNYEQGGQALQRVYAAQHGLKNGDPLWQLPLTAAAGKPSVMAYLQYEAKPEGWEKTGTKALLEGVSQSQQGNGWIDNLATARNAYYAQLPASSDAAAREPGYPSFNAQTTADMNAAKAINNVTQYGQFLDSHPDVVDAQLQIQSWENQIRKLESAPAEAAAPQASPQVQAAMNTYDALPPSKSSGNTNPATQHDRSNWIKANPGLYSQMSGYLAQNSGVGLLKNAVEAVYSGQNLNDQSFLKDAKPFGQDVVQNPGGSYAIGSGSSGSSSGGSSSSSSSDDDVSIRFRLPDGRAKPLRVYPEKAQKVRFKYTAPHVKIAKPVTGGSTPSMGQSKFRGVGNAGVTSARSTTAQPLVQQQT
jgi:hypothetical protein